MIRLIELIDGKLVNIKKRKNEKSFYDLVIIYLTLLAMVSQVEHSTLLDSIDIDELFLPSSTSNIFPDFYKWNKVAHNRISLEIVWNCNIQSDVFMNSEKEKQKVFKISTWRAKLPRGNVSYCYKWKTKFERLTKLQNILRLIDNIKLKAKVKFNCKLKLAVNSNRTRKLTVLMKSNFVGNHFE